MSVKWGVNPQTPHSGYMEEIVVRLLNALLFVTAIDGHSGVSLALCLQKCKIILNNST
jgi:hypothetical protein